MLEVILALLFLGLIVPGGFNAIAGGIGSAIDTWGLFVIWGFLIAAALVVQSFPQ